MLNKVQLIGNVGKNPLITNLDGGKKVASFTFATSEKYNGETHTEWHNISAWGKLADVIEKHVEKGSQLYLEGKIKTRKHEDKYYTGIVCNELRFLGKKGDGQSVNQAHSEPTQEESGFDEDQDAPF